MSDLEEKGLSLGEEYGGVLRDQADDVYLKYGADGHDAFWYGVVQSLSRESPELVMGFVKAAYERLAENVFSFIDEKPLGIEPTDEQAEQAAALARTHTHLRTALSRGSSFNDRALNRLQAWARYYCRSHGHDVEFGASTCCRCGVNHWNFIGGGPRRKPAAVFIMRKVALQVDGEWLWHRSETAEEHFELPPVVFDHLPSSLCESVVSGVMRVRSQHDGYNALCIAVDTSVRDGWKAPACDPDPPADTPRKAADTDDVEYDEVYDGDDDLRADEAAYLESMNDGPTPG